MVNEQNKQFARTLPVGKKAVLSFCLLSSYAFIASALVTRSSNTEVRDFGAFEEYLVNVSFITALGKIKKNFLISLA